MKDWISKNKLMILLVIILGYQTYLLKGMSRDINDTKWELREAVEKLDAVEGRLGSIYSVVS